MRDAIFALPDSTRRVGVQVPAFRSPVSIRLKGCRFARQTSVE